MAVAFVFVGTMMAPAHRKETTLFLGVVGLLAVGTAMWAALMEPNYWALWSDVFAAVGVAMAAHGISEEGPVAWWKSFIGSN
ncbi:MAG: hypothetical protein ACREE4_17770 [Stellaceae bacterium]